MTAFSRVFRRALKLYLLILGAVFVVEWGPILLGPGHVTLNSPLFDPAWRFNDWTNFILRARHLGEPGMLSRPDLGTTYPYPLPSIAIFALYGQVFKHTLPAYLVSTVAIFALASAAFSLYLFRIKAGWLAQATLWATILLGSPALFLIDRGNIEVFLWLLTLIGLVCFLKRRPYWAATCFAIAASMKIYPVLLLLLFLPRRHYKPFLLGIFVAGGLSLLALQIVGPTISGALHDFSATARALRDYQIVSLAEGSLRFDHSLLALAKQVDYQWLLRTQPAASLNPRFPGLASVYSLIAPLGFVALYFLRLRKLPLLNQFVTLVLLSVLLPYVSYDYTLIHVYLCLAVFLVYLREASSSGVLSAGVVTTTMVCFALVFAPFARLTGQHFQGQLKCLAILVLLGLFSAIPMRSRLFNDGLLEPA